MVEHDDDFDDEVQPKLARGKVILIGILIAILGVVLYVQFAPASTQPAVVTGGVTNGPTPRNVSRTPKKKVIEKSKLANPLPPVSAWPDSTLEQATINNPFIMPVTLRKSKAAKKDVARLQVELEAARLQKEKEKAEQLRASIEREKREAKLRKSIEVLNQLRNQGVDFVFTSGSKRFAKIGKHTITEGEIFNGLQIEEIKEDGTVRVRIKD